MNEFNKDLNELILDRLTHKQLERYNSTKGYWLDVLPKITKATWLPEAIAEVQRREDQRLEVLYEAYELFASKVKDRTFKAKVTNFNKHSGEGLVYIPELNATYRIYACNIAGKKTWYPETACVYYEKGQQVDVSLSLHGMGSPIFMIGQTPGHFDSDRWNSLDKCD